MAPDEILLSVPQHLNIDTGTAWASPVAPILREVPFRPSTSWCLTPDPALQIQTGWDPNHDPLPLMAFLLYALQQPTSKWRPVLDMLPRQPHHPILYDEKAQM